MITGLFSQVPPPSTLYSMPSTACRVTVLSFIETNTGLEGADT